jgi:hypothetical protein
MTRSITLEATAYHEAGHMVAAVHLGVPIRHATIVSGQNALGKYAGSIRHQPLFPMFEIEAGDIGRIEGKVSKRIIILLAGPIAQRRFRRSSWRSWHGRIDYETAADLAQTLNGGDEKATNAYLKWLSLRAERLVDFDWPDVVACAERLMSRKTLSSREVLEAIREAVA